MIYPHVKDATDLPSYQDNDPKGWGGDPSRGAAMGRHGFQHGAPEGRLVLRKVVLDSGGYDINGTYFGMGEPLFWYADDGGNVEGSFRASGNTSALEQVREAFPDAEIVTGPDIQPACLGPDDEACYSPAQEHSEYCAAHEHLDASDEDDEIEDGDEDTCGKPEKVTCGRCGRSWCERCDPCPSSLCHWCHGRGFSTAAL